MSVRLKENLEYKVKIDVPNIVELISETFDNVLNYMLPEMLVFGGALRDIIAGIGLHHDLDIAASCSEGNKFIHYLELSSKWIEECVIAQYKEQAKIMEKNILGVTSPHNMENGMLDLNRILSSNITDNKRSKFSNYGNIRSVRTFINSSGHRLQIIISKSDIFTLKDTSPINIVKAVDFICCGLMMDTDGNVYEVIEGAKDDCTKRILRINKNADIKLHNLIPRIKKLTVRGWKSEINLAKLKHKQIRLEKAAKRKTKRLEKQQNKSSMNYIRIYKLRDGKIQMVISTSKMQIFKHCRASSNKTLDTFYNMFRNSHLIEEIRSCQISISYNNNNDHLISIYAGNKDIILDLKDALLHLEHKFLPDQRHRTPDQRHRTDVKEEKLSRKTLKLSYSYDKSKVNPGMYDLIYDAGPLYGDFAATTTSTTLISSTPVTDSGGEMQFEEESGPVISKAEKPVETSKIRSEDRKLVEIPEEIKLSESPPIKLSESPPKRIRSSENFPEGSLKRDKPDNTWRYDNDWKHLTGMGRIAKISKRWPDTNAPEDSAKPEVSEDGTTTKPHKNSVKDDNIKLEMFSQGGKIELSQDDKVELENIVHPYGSSHSERISLMGRCDDLEITKEEKVGSVKIPLSRITAEGGELLSEAAKTKLAKHSALSFEYTATYNGQ